MIPIIIPAYQPDERLLDLIDDLIEHKIGPIILVNDGSGMEYDSIFDKAIEKINPEGIYLKHEINQGKGRALKTAFSYILENLPEATNAVTVDSDGQHSLECIQKIIEAANNSPDALILGVRTFDGEDIPWKSRFGNKMTETCFKYITGVHVTDTQTGLRGIPRNYMTSLIDLKGERFEFEMRMLIDACDKVEIKEVPISTIYDSKEEHQTHFNPFKDSIRIYKILLERFFKFTIVSLSSCVIDVALFALFCALLDKKINYLIYATIFARIISATYNYLVNYKFVFLSKENMTKSLIKYAALAIIQMSCSALLVHAIGSYVFVGADVVVKIIVDTILFFISYNIQKRFVF